MFCSFELFLLSFDSRNRNTRNEYVRSFLLFYTNLSAEREGVGQGWDCRPLPQTLLINPILCVSPSHTHTACSYRLRCPEDSGLSCSVSPVDRDPARGSPDAPRPLVKEPEQEMTPRFLSFFSSPPYSACLPRVGASSSPLVCPRDSSSAAPVTPWGSEFLHLYHVMCEIAFELSRLTLVANQSEEEAIFP